MAFSSHGLQSADGTLTHEAYLEINPSGFVPALQINDAEVITENPAILTYIASLAPERPVFGKDRLETAKIYRWFCWLSGTLHGNGYAMILRPARFTNDTSAHAGVVVHGRQKIEDCYERIEKSLEGEHIIGDGFTVVDINLYIFWGWGKRNNFEMDKLYPKYGQLVKAVEKLDSVKAALKAEGLPLQF